MTTPSASARPEGDARVLTRSLDALLREAAERFPLLACATAQNAASEQARLVLAWTEGREVSPDWIAPAIDRAALAKLRRAFESACAALHESRDPWLALYRGRLVEVAHELALVDAAFGEGVNEHARRRFAASAHDADADQLATHWLAADDDDEGAEARITSDDERDPRSLLSQMRRAIGARGLGVRILARERIGALAAAGDGIVIVAKGRPVTEREAARVVLHEVEGHVLPRERGRAGPHGLCALGSAGSSEDEEGRALVLEERAGSLDVRRRRALAARHVSARLVTAGASYVELVRWLRDDANVPIEDALATATRVMRGAHRRGDDLYGGVARERVYLPAFVRVREAVTADDAMLERLGRARLSLAALRVLGL